MRKLCEYGEVHDFFDDPIRSLGMGPLTDGPLTDLWPEVRWALLYATLRDVRNYTL